MIPLRATPAGIRLRGCFLFVTGQHAGKLSFVFVAGKAFVWYPDCSMAVLYDEATMPPELRKAHQANDRAVMEAYGMPIKGTTESSCVAELMRRYQAMTATETKK